MIITQYKEVHEMYFITSGHVAVGYTLLSEVHQAKYLQENQTFGDYSCFENKKSEFHYTAVTEVEGFAIRKRKILDILERFSDKHQDFANQLRVQVFTNYRNLIRNHVNEHKQDNIKQLRERGEYDEFGVPEFNVRQLNEEEFVEKEYDEDVSLANEISFRVRKFCSA